MPLYRITVKQMKVSNGIRIEKGMSVDVVTNSIQNPLCSSSEKQKVADAFMRIYGIDMNKIGALNQIYLNVDRIG